MFFLVLNSSLLQSDEDEKRLNLTAFVWLFVFPCLQLLVFDVWMVYAAREISQQMTFDSIRVRFLLGGRHGDFKFLPPSGYAPCYEALLPKEKMKVEPVKEYKRDVAGVRDLLGTAQLLSQASFIPTPVETSQVKTTGAHQ